MKNNKGYTLAELLVSIAIFSIIIVSIILFMRNASVAYKNENIEVNIQKEAQIFMSQVEDLVVDSISKIELTSDPAGNPKYKIVNPDGTFYLTYIPGINNTGKVYFNDSYLMAEKVSNFEITGYNDTTDNECLIHAVFAYNDASSAPKTYDVSKKVYFRNTAIENNADHTLDLSVSAPNPTGGGTANSRVIDRFEIVNLKDEFEIVTVTQIDNTYYKCLATDSTHFSSTTDDVITPEYSSTNTFLVTTCTAVNDNPNTNVTSSILKGTKADGSTVEVTLSTPAVSLTPNTGVVEYPNGHINESSGSGKFVSYIPLVGFDVNDYNKYWKPKSNSNKIIKYDMKLLKDTSEINSVTGKTVNGYIATTEDNNLFNANKVRWDSLSNNSKSMNQGDAMTLCADDYCNDNLVVAYNNEGNIPPEGIFNNGKIKMQIKVYFVKSDCTTYYDKGYTYTIVSGDTPYTSVN